MSSQNFYSEGEIADELAGRFNLPRGCRFMTFCPYGIASISSITKGSKDVDLDQYDNQCILFVESNDVRCSSYRELNRLLEHRLRRK